MLDEEGSTSKSDNIYTNTIDLIVRSGADQDATIQLWPCVNVPATSQIPQAVKDIYSKLAHAANEPDQGIPQLLLSLIGSGNVFSNETSDYVLKGLKRFVGRCGLWVVSSGEFADPLARVFAQTLRNSLVQLDDPSETLFIVANNSNVIYKTHQMNQRHIEMVDSRYNTLYVVLNNSEASALDTLAFRSRFAMKLACPPPALLIGVPDERAGYYSTAQTPITSAAPAIILPNSLMQCERKPLPVALFCGASIESLLELAEFVECGVPVLVIQYEAEERDVERFFKGYGEIRDILMKKGFCFVEIPDSRDAEDAVKDLHGKDIMGMKVVVEIAKGRERRFDESRSGGGGGRGCYNCGRDGHFSRECKAPRKERMGGGGRDRRRSRSPRRRDSRSPRRGKSRSGSPPARRSRSPPPRQSRSRSLSR